MKKIFKIALTLVLSASGLFGSACSCSGGEGTNSGSSSAGSSNNQVEYVDNIYLAKDGKTDYTVVIPSTVSEYISFAADELIDLFKEATGATLSVEDDSGLAYSEEEKYISIGETAIKTGSGVVADYATVKNSGARVVTQGNNVILAGSTDEGALYAVYDFLNALFEYEFYDVDAYKLVKKSVVQLPKLDITDVPDNDYRRFGDYLQEESVGGNRQHAYRLRYKVSEQDYALSGHSATVIVSPKDYPDKTPERIAELGNGEKPWFTAAQNTTSPDDRQLCYTSDEMTAQFIENAKKYLAKSPETTRISFAQADINSWCECDTCQSAIAKYGNGKEIGSVTQILFLNKVVPALNEWLAEEYPGRRVVYCVLAYHQTVDAPAHKDASGKYIPNGSENGDMSMVLNDSVSVEYADIYASRNLSFKDNPTTRERLMAWSACTKGLSIYEYPQDALNVCLPYDGLHVFADNIRFSCELGFSQYFMQGNFNTQSSGFQELKAYVAAKLMWDSSLDPIQLAYDYIENVYGEAAPYIKSYFIQLREKLAELRYKYDYGSFVLSNYLDSRYWPRTLMIAYEKIFADAYKAIDSVQYIDREHYEVLFRKIKIEEMFIEYVNCDLYGSILENKEERIDAFEKYAKAYGFKCWSESAPMSDKIAQWRNA